MFNLEKRKGMNLRLDFKARRNLEKLKQLHSEKENRKVSKTYVINLLLKEAI